MIGLDMLSMTEEESDEYFSCLVMTDYEIEKIINLDPISRNLPWLTTVNSALMYPSSVYTLSSRLGPNR